jgi:hypothetical protein
MVSTSPVFGINPSSEDGFLGAKVSHGDISGLPRSVRWRIQLGLLKEPYSNCKLSEVTAYNREIIAQQDERFKGLVEKHVEEDQDEGEVQKEGQDVDKDMAGGVPEVDPLTAMVMEQEAIETRKAELYLKYRKEKARRKRGLTTEARIIESESEEVDRASVRKQFDYHLHQVHKGFKKMLIRSTDRFAISFNIPVGHY